jgi:hypothetical protein
MNKIVKYIFRKWDKNNRPPHPLIGLIPPILFEVSGYLIGLVLLLELIKWPLS